MLILEEERAIVITHDGRTVHCVVRAWWYSNSASVVIQCLRGEDLNLPSGGYSCSGKHTGRWRDDRAVFLVTKKSAATRIAVQSADDWYQYVGANVRAAGIDGPLEKKTEP